MMRVLIPSHSEPNEYPIFFSGSSLTITEAGPEGNRDSWCPDFYQQDPISRRPAPAAKPVHLAASSAPMDSTTDSPTDSPMDSRKYRKRRTPSMPSDSFRFESTDMSDREATDLSDKRLKSSLDTPRELNSAETSDEVRAAENILTGETDLSDKRLKRSLDTPRELNSAETSDEVRAAENILTGETDLSGNRLKSSLDTARKLNSVETSDEVRAAENILTGETDLSGNRLKSSLDTPRELNSAETTDKVRAAKNIFTGETDLSGNRLKSSLDTPRELNSVETSDEVGAATIILTGETDSSGNRLKSSLDTPRHPNPVESSDEIAIAENKIADRPGSQPDDDSSPSGRKWGLKPLSYNYPLNQAIQANASLDVLEAIIPVAPEALFLPDGQELELALHVLVRHRPCERGICDMLLLKSPAAAAFTDRYKNTALHVACSSGAGIDIVRHLCAVNPHAIEERNFHGLTPLDIAVRRTTCSEEVVDYLTQTHLSLCRPFDDG